MNKQLLMNIITLLAIFIVFLCFNKSYEKEGIDYITEIKKLKTFTFDTDINDAEMQRTIFQGQEEERQRLNSHPQAIQLFHYSIVPEIFCETMVRIGDPTDGGKWICNPWRLSNPCVVHSWGVGRNPTFEIEMDRLLNGRCRLFSFDPFPGYASFFKDTNNITFTPLRMDIVDDTTGFRVGGKATLQGAMRNFKHQFVDILKMDIEGSEHKILPFIVKKKDPLFCQLLIELHGSDPWRKTLQLLSNAGYLLFSKEINTYCCSHCVEYCFIHESCLAKFGLRPSPIHRNFPPNDTQI